MKRSHASITMRSIISSAAGMMPAPMISPTASAAWRTDGERREQGLRALGQRQQAHRAPA